MTQLPARLTRTAAVVLLVSLSACSGSKRAAPPQGDAGVVVTPNHLQACADVPLCEAGCRNGAAEDCLAAATSYGEGKGAPRDEARSAAFFAAGCTLGSGPGCNLAGRAYEFGHGVPVDFPKAFSFYEKACNGDYIAGCYNVAILLEKGRGTPKDDARAAALYAKVCSAGSQVACESAERLKPAR